MRNSKVCTYDYCSVLYIFVYALNATNEGSDCECGMYAWDCIYNKMKSISNLFKMKMSLRFFEKQGEEFPGKTMLDVCVRGRKMNCHLLFGRVTL